jgi:hypothetical protein
MKEEGKIKSEKSEKEVKLTEKGKPPLSVDKASENFSEVVYCKTCNAIHEVSKAELEKYPDNYVFPDENLGKTRIISVEKVTPELITNLSKGKSVKEQVCEKLEKEFSPITLTDASHLKAIDLTEQLVRKEYEKGFEEEREFKNMQINEVRADERMKLIEEIEKFTFEEVMKTVYVWKTERDFERLVVDNMDVVKAIKLAVSLARKHLLEEIEKLTHTEWSDDTAVDQKNFGILKGWVIV